MRTPEATGAVPAISSSRVSTQTLEVGLIWASFSSMRRIRSSSARGSSGFSLDGAVTDRVNVALRTPMGELASNG